jgi:hypothetical protein
MDIEPIIQQAQSISVYREIESARLMEYKDIEDEDRIRKIDDVEEYNMLMDAEVMINQGNFFDLYV